MGTALRERAEKEIRERARVAGERARDVGGRLGGRFGQGTNTARQRLGKATKDTRRKVGYWVAGEQPPKTRTRLWAAIAVGAGAVAAFFLDPVSGKRRRHVTRSWIAGRFRRAGTRTARVGRAVGSEAYGKWQAVKHAGEETDPENDITLAEKVRSEAFAGLDLPSRINVNAESGVVYLRGQVKRPDEIRDIERRVRDIRGVRGVVNLLHVSG
ncbi:MAG TPA: BON domain-containing protein, partial [Actinomycetota bacterium]|nr:BON domain-containing protein [Actinomycetota bacterium]